MRILFLGDVMGRSGRHALRYHLPYAIKNNNIDFDNLPEDIQHVLVNMCFNLGANRLDKFRNMLYAVSVSNWQEMSNQMEDSRWYGQVGRRSKELQELVLGCES